MGVSAAGCPLRGRADRGRNLWLSPPTAPVSMRHHRWQRATACLLRSGWTGFKTDGVLDRRLTRSAADGAQQHHDEAADREHLREPEPERPFQQHESIVCDVAPQRRKTLARIAA